MLAQQTESTAMKFSSRVLNLAATVVFMGVPFAIAADKQPPSESAAQPAPRQVDQKEVEAGRAAAQADIRKKLIRYDIVGQPSMIDPELKRLAASKYNISVTFHGCCAGPRIDFDRAYLEVVIAHLKTLHGFDPVAKLEKDLREKQK
ncbi:MAG: hypothetical protein RI957_1731 [Verrucomicrobiota bacterium]|jgi:hypothetical protein